MENNNNPLLLIAVIALFAAVFGYIIYAKLKRKSASWTGTVIDKNMTESASASMNNRNNNSNGITFGGNRNAINRHYSLKIKTDAGEELNWPVGEGFYQTIQVGDRLTKSPGTETPTKAQPIS